MLMKSLQWDHHFISYEIWKTNINISVRLAWEATDKDLIGDFRFRLLFVEVWLGNNTCIEFVAEKKSSSLYIIKTS
jgi:hypothetical protein